MAFGSGPKGAEETIMKMITIHHTLQHIQNRSNRELLCFSL